MSGFAVRGVIEGFYGRPWTRAERLEMVDFLGARGMNTFVYGPKDDPMLRRDWRTPFGGTEHAELTELRERCHLNGMRLLVCVSPGLTIRYSDDADVAALSRKLVSAIEAGADGVGLLLDDIPFRLQHEADLARFSSLAAAHASLAGAVATAVRDAHPDASLFVCPTLYCGYGDEPYLADLAAGVPVDVDICWTGRAICSPTLDLADAEVFAATTGRPPLYWDNYPVNDVAMTYEAHLGPYLGRDPRLVTGSRGVVANPMELVESSKIPLATVADFLADPAGYDPERSWERAIADVVGDPADAAAFRTYADNVRYSCLEPSDAPALVALLEDLAFAIAVGPADRVVTAAAAVASYGDGLLEAIARIGSLTFANRRLAAEQEPWLRTAAIGAEALVALGATVRAHPGDPEGPAVVAALAPHLDRWREQRHRVFGDVLGMTLTDLVQPPGSARTS